MGDQDLLALSSPGRPVGSIVRRYTDPDPQLSYTRLMSGRAEPFHMLFGGDGDDQLRGGPDADILIGGPGDDTFEVGLDCEAVAGEVIDGGPGNDTVLSHLSQRRLEELGVTIRSIENFVTQPEDLEGDCDAKPWKVHPSDIVSVDLDQNFYAKADEVVLDIAARRSDLTVWADFSAVDSAYVVGDETLTGVGTTALQLRYQLSGSSTVQAGNIRLPIEVRDTGGRLIHRFGVALKYAPSGVPSMVPQSGVFRLAAQPSRPDSGWRVQSAMFVSSVPAVPPPPQFDFSTTPTIPAAERTLEVTVRAPASPSLGDIVQLELGEKDRDGTFAVLGAVQPSCTPISGTSDCDYVIEVGFDAATGDAVLEPLDIRILDAVGGISPATEFPLQAEGIDPAWARVKGRVLVQYDRQDADIWDDDAWQAGSFSALQTFPLPHGTRVRLNLCGQVDTGTVDINGDFSLGFFTNCIGEDDGFVEVFSSTGGAATNRIAVGSWIGTSPITNAASLTNDPDDYAVYVVRVGNALRVDDATASGGLDLGTMTIEQSSYAGAVGAFVGMRGVIDAIKYAVAFDGVGLLDLPSVNILAGEDICLASGQGDKEAACDTFAGETRTSIHPGFFYVQNERIFQEWVYAHEWGHVFHLRMLRSQRYNEFGEGYANVIAQAALQVAGRAQGGWTYPLGGVAAENMDFNGQSNPSGGQTEQIVLNPFFASTTDAAVIASQYGCDEPDEEGDPPPTTEQMGNCVMSQPQGGIWRIYWDLHDGSGVEPISTFVDDEGNVTSVNATFDQVDGGGYSGGHAFHNRLLGYVASAQGGGTHPNYEDRGQTKLDLVDVLDAMTCKGVTEAEAGDLLVDVHGYDYDFDPPELTCN